MPRARHALPRIRRIVCLPFNPLCRFPAFARLLRIRILLCDILNSPHPEQVAHWAARRRTHEEGPSMTNIYERLGVTPIINACGPNTRLSGGIMAPEVAQAMVEASQHCVDMVELQARASELIAETTGAEAGLVTSGAAAGVLLGLAACVTGLDPDKMNRLPDTAGMKSEIV